MARRANPARAGGARQRLPKQFDAADQTRTKPTLQSIYSGRTLLGFLTSRGKLSTEAYTPDEVSIGVFSTIKAAADALSDAAEQWGAAS